jgi:aspartate/methionine/tyrosine aminotransferase
VAIRPIRLVADLERVGSREIEDLVAAAAPPGRLALRGGPVLPLPLHLREAAIAALSGPDRRPARGLPELRHALAGILAAETGRPVDAERQLILTNGAMQGLSTVFRSLLAPGDEVVIPVPTFFFDGALKLAGAVPVHVPCREEEGWSWDAGRIGAAVTPRTRMLLVCNPTNPTGFLPRRDDIAALVGLAEMHDLVLVSDESYHYAAYDFPFTSLASFPDDAGRHVTVRSLSKSHALANWRMGYVHAAAALVDGFAKVVEWECLHCGYVQQQVTLAAVAGPQGWLAGVNDEYRGLRDRVAAAFARSAWLSAVTPAGGTFFFPDLSRAEAATGVDGFAQLLALGVVTVPGRFFHGAGHVRLPFGGAPETIGRLVDLIANFVPNRGSASAGS